MNWPEAVAYLQTCPPAKAKEQLLRLAMSKCKVKPVRLPIRRNKGMKKGSVGYRMVKTETLPKLKKELDRVFSIWCRSKDADENGIVSCVTCGLRKHWRQMDAGHYCPRQDLNTRWDMRNVWPQCKACNGFRGGEPEKMAAYIAETCGQEVPQRLRFMSKLAYRLSRDWIKDQIKIFESLIEAEGPATPERNANSTVTPE